MYQGARCTTCQSTRLVEYLRCVGVWGGGAASSTPASCGMPPHPTPSKAPLQARKGLRGQTVFLDILHSFQMAGWATVVPFPDLQNPMGHMTAQFSHTCVVMFPSGFAPSIPPLLVPLILGPLTTGMSASAEASSTWCELMKLTLDAAWPGVWS
jgi:hypothetical protein